ncbi:MAG: MraY family glycosyltransferase [Limisphaerales bacterium]
MNAPIWKLAFHPSGAVTPDNLNFPFNFFLAAFAGALLTTLLALPIWRKWCLRTNLVDDPRDGKNYDAPKIHDSPVPLAGGLAVLTGILLPLIAGAIFLKFGILKISFAELIVHGINRRAIELGAIAIGAIAMTVLGWADDRHELKPLPKFAGQFLIALLVAAAGARVTLFVPNIFFSYAITILWLLTIINAFNFMDNMNGLCAGLGAIGALLFAIIAAADGEYLVALIAFLTCGALLGFLPYNFPNARAFLGDAGSHLVGYLLAVLAILPHFYTKQNPNPLAVLSPLLVLAIPLIDLAQVVILRTFNRKPFWIGDTNHLSHRLARAGFSRTRAVLVIWLIAAMIGALATINL